MRKQVVMSVILSVVLTGCNSAYQFTAEESGRNLPGIADDPGGGPTDPPVCIIGSISVQTPPSVISGESFSMQVTGMRNPVWTLSLGAQSLSFTGSDVRTSLTMSGNWQGQVVGINNCNDSETRSFSIQVQDEDIQVGMLINSNDVYTNSASVLLSMTYLNVDEVYITNTPNCVDGGTWEPVTASKAWTLTNLNTTSSVYAKFRNPRTETACISDDIVHDDILPTIAFVRTPSHPTNSTSAEFEFSANDAGSGIAGIFCRIDGTAYRACASVETFSSLSQGQHSVDAYASDRAGNRSATISFSWMIDASGPSVQITSAPPTLSTDSDASFAFTASAGPSGLRSIECQLDGAAFAACTSPTAYTSLTDGAHSFQVRATDNTGLTAIASHNWNIDTRTQTQPITIIGSGRADILFVVDNSPSMFSELRESISYRFGRFIEYLGTTDFRIAVTTGDAVGSREYEAGRMTRILRASNPGSGIAISPLSYFISPIMSESQRNFSATIRRPEATCVQVGTHLCPTSASNYQEGIYATTLALQRPENASFFRDEASLHVVVISDTDETSRAYVSPSGDISANLPERNRPQTLMAAVANQFPEKTFKFHAVIRPTNADTCANSSNVDARKAPIYQQMVQTSGGQIVNICRDLDRSEVQQLANQIRGTGNRYSLRCVPTDENGDGQPDVQAVFSPQPAQPIQTVVSDQSVRFVPEPAAGTQVTLTYRCP